MKLTRLLGGAAALTLATAGAALADYPERTITMVVPFSAGGPTDTVARLVAEVMSRELGQQVIVQNVGGAGGTLGAGQVAKADADGYTLLLHHIGMATTAILYRSLPFNALTDFEYVGLVTDVPMVIVARKDFPPSTLPEFMTYVKENADDVTMANAGIGAASHLCGMMFMSAIDTQLVTVPYQGTGPAMTDLLGSQVDLMCDQTTNTTAQIQGGTIKAYATTTGERLAVFPDLPTAAEGGLENFEIGIWHGIYAPKGTPSDAMEKLSTALQAALRDDKVIASFADLGTLPEPQEYATPAALQAKLKAEIDLWRPVIQAAGIYAD